MSIMYVNPGRRGRKRLRVSGRAKVGKVNPRQRRRAGGRKRRKGRMPAALAAYWAKKRGKKSRRATRSGKRRGNRKRSKQMARRRKRRARKSPVRRRRRRKAKGVVRRRRRKSGGKRRRKSRRKSSGRRRRRRARKAAPRRRRRRSRKRARKTRRRSRRRARRSYRTKRIRRRRRGTVLMYGGAGQKTIKMNPRRRRRSRRRSSKRRSRRVHRRYGRRYRKNPGGMLIDLAKRAAPVLIGLYGARLLVSRLGPRIPGVTRLGSLQGPVLAIAAILGVNWVTKKVGKLAKYRNELMLGTALSALDTLIGAFAPASVKALIGAGDVYDRALGEYVQMSPMGEYIHSGAGQPVDDMDLSLGEYVATGDVQEELGVDEELGLVEEELGESGDFMGSNAMLGPVPQQSFLEPVPTRSFTRPIGSATAQYASPKGFYRGIFAG